MIRSAAGKVMWVGRATVFLVGLAVILALVFGVASTAFAHKGNKGFFHLGHKNVSQAVSKLVGKVAGPSLFIGNGSEAPRATALRLNVKPGKPPLKVNSDKKVPNLNADQIDGKDSHAFLSSSTYFKSVRVDGTANRWTNKTVRCDSGDHVVSGGYWNVDRGTTVERSLPSSGSPGGSIASGWSIGYFNDATADTIYVAILCADTTP